MAEYIEREALLDSICHETCRIAFCGATYCAFMAEVCSAPAADVAPVVNGRWEHLGGDEWCCSACGFVITTEGSWDKPTKKYCEDCGAKMDGGADNDTN